MAISNFLLVFYSSHAHYPDSAPNAQQELFIKKLLQCNFTDHVADPKSKEIKRACLNELVDYVTASRGILSYLAVYSEFVKMVSET